MIKVLSDAAAGAALLEIALEVIDTYMTQSSDESVFNEPTYIGTFNADLNAFLKSADLGKSEAATPRLRQALSMQKTLMGRGTAPTPRSLIQAAAVSAS